MQAPSPPPAATPPAGECKEDAVRFAIGNVLDASLAEQIRSHSGAQRVRVVRPGQMVTMDFDERRLTLELDAADRVVKARCG